METPRRRIKPRRSELAAAYFREMAKSWDQIRSLRVDDSNVEKEVIDQLNWERISSMIDLGTGHFLERFGPRLKQSEGIDQSREMLEVARANLRAASLPHCQVRQGNLYQIPNQTSTFDLAIIQHVLHFVVDFASHALEHLRVNDNHHLGFSDTKVDAWFESAGLTHKSITKLVGKPLTVCIWITEEPSTCKLNKAFSILDQTSQLNANEIFK
jgi:ArsR family transcriptional regulator